MSRAKKIVYHLPYLCVASFLALFIFLTYSVNVYAASDQVAHFPYVLADEHYRNDFWSAYIEQTITSNSTVTNFVGNDPYIIFVNYAYPNASTPHIKVDGYVNPSVRGNYDLTTFDYLSNNFNINYTKSFSVDISYNSGGSLSFTYTTSNRSDWSGMFGNQTSGTIAGFTYIHRYPVYVSNEVFTSGDPNFTPIILDHLGTGLDPDVFDPSDALEISDIISEEFTNLPTIPSSPFDSSLSVIENIWNFFTWLGKILRALFSNLLHNLVILFNGVISSLNNGFTFLSNNLTNFFKDFYDRLLDKLDTIISNFSDFVGDIVSPFNHFLEVVEFCYRLGVVNNEFSLAEFLSALFVPSSNDIDNAFTGHSVNTLYHGTVTASKTYYNFFTSVFSGDYVYIYSLPNFSFGGKDFQGLEVNFSWFLQYKTYCDLIISAFLIIGYIRFLLHFINNFFYGSGFIDHDLNTIGGEKGIDYTIPY